MMRTTHIRRSETDARRMDLVCPGLDGVFGGMPIFADVTCVSPLRGNGTPMHQAADQDGAAVAEAERKNLLLITLTSKRLLTQFFFVWAWRPSAVGVTTAPSWSASLLSLKPVMPTPCSQNHCSTLMLGGGGRSFRSPSKQTSVAQCILRPAGSDLTEAATHNASAREHN